MTRLLASTAPIVGVVLATLALATVPLTAQTITGQLFETGTTTPIASATVYLLDEDSNQVDVVETDEDGAFTLEASEPGAYYVQAEMTGYRTKTDGVLQLGAGGEISIRFFLMPQPIESSDSLLAIGKREDPIAAARTRFLEGQGFFKRLSDGFGEFITPEEIEERNPKAMRDIFWKVRGVRIDEFSGTDAYTLPNQRRVMGEVIMLSRGRTPTVYIDGSLAWPPASGAGCGSAGSPSLSRAANSVWPFPVEDFLDPTSIRAVEVYDGPSEIPAQYNGVASCGVILIWTG